MVARVWRIFSGRRLHLLVTLSVCASAAIAIYSIRQHYYEVKWNVQQHFRSLMTRVRAQQTDPQSVAIITPQTLPEGGAELPPEPRLGFLAEARAARFRHAELRPPSATEAEELVFDELDFYHHPACSSDSYPGFVPERVRRHNAYYYFRHANRGPEGAYSGSRFGEVVLREAAGSVKYLPRYLLMADTQAITFAYRKSDPQAKVSFTLYRKAKSLAKVVEGEASCFPRTADTAWHEVRIPYADLKFAPTGRFADEPDLNSAEDLLRYYQPPGDMVYALEFGMQDSRAESSLYLDRIAMVRSQPASRVLRGKTSPPTGGVPVRINTNVGSQTVVTNRHGEFQLTLAPEVQRYEIYSRHQDRWFAPRSGRYFELGSYAAAVEIPISSEPNTKFPTHKSSISYKTTAEKGIAYPENQHFLQGNNYKDKPQEFEIETSSNRLGYLDRDRRPENPDGALRIIVIGECYHCGILVDMQEAFGMQAEAILNFHDSPPVEVMLMGSPSTALTAGAAVFKNLALKHKPDLVLFSFMSNTAYPAYVHRELSMKWFGYDPEHPGHTTYDVDPSSGALVEYPVDPDYPAFMQTPVPTDKIYETLGVNEFNLVHFDRDASPAAKQVKKVLLGAFGQFQQMAASQGCQVGVIYSADGGSIQKAKWSEGSREFDMACGYKFWEQIAAKTGIKVFDISGPIAEKAKTRSGKYFQIWPVAGHWTPAGNRFAAEGLVEALAGPHLDREFARKQDSLLR